MKQGYEPIDLDYENSNDLDYENSNDPDYESDESSETPLSRSYPEVVIPTFEGNKDDYTPYEFMTNQTSYTPNDKPEPTTYEEAIRGPESTAWKKAMQEEFDSLNENQTWNLVELPAGSKVLGGKWVLDEN